MAAAGERAALRKGLLFGALAGFLAAGLLYKLGLLGLLVSNHPAP